MTREQFDNLVQKVEQKYRGKANALRLRVLLWALLGYTWFIFWICVVFGIAAGLIALGVALDSDGILFDIVGTLVLGYGLIYVARAFWVTIPAPKGRAITRTDAPVLFSTLEEIRVRLNTLRFHRILISHEFNACVIQRPALGIFGWSRNYLILGLPLMEALNPEEFKAILVHEMAHISRRDGRLGHWLYRLRLGWEQVFAQLQNPSNRRAKSLRSLSAKFADWFWPRFNAHAFVLSRTAEYLADRTAADFPGLQQHAIAGLCRVSAGQHFFADTFWPEIRCLAKQNATPPEDFLACFREILERTLANGEMEKHIAAALRRAQTNADTHPCPADRIKALGCSDLSPTLPPLNPDRATQVFLGSAGELIRREVNAEWRKELVESWTAENRKASILQRQLVDISGVKAGKDPDVIWDRARMQLQLENLQVAEEMLREVLEIAPHHINALLCLGQLLLDREEPEGEALVERAIEREPECIPDAAKILLQYFRRCGRADAIRTLEARLDQHERNQVELRKELASISKIDPFIHHGLSVPELETLRKAMAEFPEIDYVTVAQKQLTYSKRQKFFLLGVYLKRSRWGRVDTDRESRIVSKLAMSTALPGRMFVFAPRGSYSGLARAVSRVAEAKVENR
jgi:Zn-dependent protease with chaperone function